jgi:hypothetical protein
MPTRKLVLAALVAALALGALVLPALADGGHGRPDCAGQLDEAGFGTRDGWDHAHVQDPSSGVPNSLAEVEGYLSACRTNDAVIAEAVAGNARVIRSTGVLRVLLRARLQRFYATDPDGGGPLVAGWNTRALGPAVNTETARTLTVTTPFLNEVASVPSFEHGWHRVLTTAQVRYTNGQLRAYSIATYAVWLGDGPTSPAAPPPPS